MSLKVLGPQLNDVEESISEVGAVGQEGRKHSICVLGSEREHE